MTKKATKTVAIKDLKSFTVDGKIYDFIPLDEWELNDCCLFEDIAGVEYQTLLGEGALAPKNLRAAMYVVAKHHGLDLTLEEAGQVKMMQFMEAAAGEIADQIEDGADRPPARPPRKSRARATSSSG